MLWYLMSLVVWLQLENITGYSSKSAMSLMSYFLSKPLITSRVSARSSNMSVPIISIEKTLSPH